MYMYVVTVFRNLDNISKVYTVDTGLLWVNCCCFVIKMID